jgi:hypothetical protein
MSPRSAPGTLSKRRPFDTEESAMRLAVSLPLLLAAAVLAPASVSSAPSAAAPAPRPVSFRPRAWQPPAARHAVAAPAARAAAPAMVEGSDPLPSPFDPEALGRTRAEALANVKIELRADGSRHAVLGNAIRAYSVAHVDENGQLQMDCATSEADAIARARKLARPAAAPAPSAAPAAPASRGGK